MKVEYRVILTAIFDTAADREAAYTVMKNAMTTWAGNNAGKFKRADMTKDEYYIPDGNVTEKVA